MSRRMVVTALIPQPDPEPTYPEYEDVRKEARGRDAGPIDRHDIVRMETVIQRRGGDWCTAVLGRPFPGLGRASSLDGFTLLVADERGLAPELPPRILAARAAEEARRKEREAQAAAKLDAEKRRWDLVTSTAPVPFSVQANTRHTGVRGPLRHVTATVDLVSGRSRLHKAGSALCETPGRTNPLHLGAPLKDLPPTCRRCIEYAGLVRTLDAPAPPSAAERKLLTLVKDGAVATFYVRRCVTVRDTSQRSNAAWGHLGRKVDVAMRKLEKKGWVVQDERPSATQRAGSGHLWRLTEAGTAALEG